MNDDRQEYDRKRAYLRTQLIQAARYVREAGYTRNMWKTPWEYIVGQLIVHVSDDHEQSGELYWRIIEILEGVEDV